MKKLLAYLYLVRPHNCAIAAVSVWVGQFLTPKMADSRPDIFAMLAAFLVCGFGNVLNDILDINADRINHPQRPLPSGKVSLRGGRILAGIILSLILCDMFWLTASGSMICLVATMLLISYNYRLKRVAYIGNLIIAVLGGLTFVLGGARSGWSSVFALPGPLIPTVFAVLMHFGREIIKDIQDITGDRNSGSRTAPIQFGMSISLLSASIIYLLLGVVTMAAYMIGWFTTLFFYINLFCIYLPVLLQFLWLGSHPTSDRCRTVSFLLRLEMLIGLAALILGKGY